MFIKVLDTQFNWAKTRATSCSRSNGSISPSHSSACSYWTARTVSSPGFNVVLASLQDVLVCGGATARPSVNACRVVQGQPMPFQWKFGTRGPSRRSSNCGKDIKKWAHKKSKGRTIRKTNLPKLDLYFSLHWSIHISSSSCHTFSLDTLEMAISLL